MGKIMSLILFIHQDAFKKGDVLKIVIDRTFYEIKRQTIRTFNALKARLKKSSSFTEKDIFILLADSRSRLTELISLVDLFEGKCVILILSDESTATLSMATQFFPRFFTPVSETYGDLCDVLNKMINQENKKIESI
jgi:hypothetical protein